MMLRLRWLPEGDPRPEFPPADQALAEPNGLLAVGGDLEPERLEAAYRSGIFPWYAESQPILWWSPDPRAVILPGGLRVSRSLRRRLNGGRYQCTFDRRFAQVLRACAAPRPDQDGTWITREMVAAYQRLHARGLAHSVEVWEEEALAGGLYGVAIGGCFFAESMFSARRDASKVALAWLTAQLWRWGFELLDCQISSPHLLRMGAVEIPREEFLARLELALARRGPRQWRFDDDLDPREAGGREGAHG